MKRLKDFIDKAVSCYDDDVYKHNLPIDLNDLAKHLLDFARENSFHPLDVYGDNIKDEAGQSLCVVNLASIINYINGTEDRKG